MKKWHDVVWINHYAACSISQKKYWDNVWKKLWGVVWINKYAACSKHDLTFFTKEASFHNIDV